MGSWQSLIVPNETLRNSQKELRSPWPVRQMVLDPAELRVCVGGEFIGISFGAGGGKAGAMRGSTPRARPLHQDRAAAAKALAMGTGDSNIPRMICPARVGNAWLNPAPFVPQCLSLGAQLLLGGREGG